MHILLIEPDRILSTAYQIALERAGHSVSAASSAQSAVHAADTKQPDIVVLELQLPQHNGIEFLYEFRSYTEWQHIPVIVHSFVPAGELAGTAMLRRELGVVAILHKPATSLAQLCAAIYAAGPAAV